jgi:STE24 endopeptidase
MNAYSITILSAIVLRFIINVIAQLLNLKACRLEAPSSLEGIYKPDEYYTSQEYTRARTRLSLIVSSFDLVLIIVFWFIGGFNYYDQLIRSWGFVPIVNGLFYFGILMLAYSLISLPFSLYATFVIEERFGFNKTTPRIFITDRIKTLVLTVIIGTPILTIVLTLFEYAGYFAWVFCWILVVLFSLGIQFVAPIWIMPLFNKFSPMEPSRLKESILQYADSVNFPISNVFVMDGSKRSSKSNAFFTGLGRNRRIVLLDTLIQKHSIPELIAVMAHEVGHYKKKHILQGLVLSIIHTGIILFLLSVFINSSGLYQGFYLDQPSIYSGLLFFGLLYTPLEMALSIILQIISRRNELQADRFATETIDRPGSLISALKKLSADNLSNLTPHPFYVFLNYSHPPLIKRIKAIQRFQSQHP